MQAIRLDGSTFDLTQARGTWVALLMAVPGCKITWKMIPDLAVLAHALSPRVAMYVLYRGSLGDARAIAQAAGQELDIMATAKESVADRYRVRVSPFVHVIDPSGIVRARGLVDHREHVEHLLATAGFDDPSLSHHQHSESVLA